MGAGTGFAELLGQRMQNANCKLQIANCKLQNAIDHWLFRDWRILMWTRRGVIVFLAIVFGVMLGLSNGNCDEVKPLGPEPQKWERLVDKGIEYLRNAQAPDGSWSAKQPM